MEAQCISRLTACSYDVVNLLMHCVLLLRVMMIAPNSRSRWEEVAGDYAAHNDEVNI